MISIKKNPEKVGKLKVGTSAATVADGDIIVSGNVGVGTGASAPLSKLNVKGTQGNWRIDPDTVSTEIQALASNTANSGFIDYRLRANQVILDAGGSPRLTIDSSGNITTASDGIALKLDGSSNTTRGIFIRNTGGSAHGYLHTDGNLKLIAEDSGKSINFYTADDGTGTARLSIASTGLCTFANGIAFSQTNSTATGVSDDSTTLSHYESGSWSPTLFKGTIGGTLTQHTGASVYGKYVRIGNLVWVSFYILQGAGGTQSASGQWVVKGLPFPVKEGAAAGHQSLVSNYFQLNGTNFFNASPHRWQANATDALQMYGTQNATTWSSGAMEFGGAGVLHIDY